MSGHVGKEQLVAVEAPFPVEAVQFLQFGVGTDLHILQRLGRFRNEGVERETLHQLFQQFLLERENGLHLEEMEG